MRIARAILTDDDDRLVLHAASQAVGVGGAGTERELSAERREEVEKLLRGLAFDRSPLSFERLDRALTAVAEAIERVLPECTFEYWRSLVGEEAWTERSAMMAEALVQARQQYLLDLMAGREFLTVARNHAGQEALPVPVPYPDDPRIALYHHAPVSGLLAHHFEE